MYDYDLDKKSLKDKVALGVDYVFILLRIVAVIALIVLLAKEHADVVKVLKYGFFLTAVMINNAAKARSSR